MSKQSREQGRTERAAAIRAAQARNERNRRVGLIAGIVVLLVAIVGAGAWLGSGGKDKKDDTTASSLVAAEASLQMGDDDAPVKIVIYEDFLCPFCRELETSTRDFLEENADKGKVYVEYRPINLLRTFPYSARALNAWAAVLKHGSPEAALRLHGLLFDNQPYEQSSEQTTDSQIAEWVKEAGGDNADVRKAMKTEDTAFFDAAQAAMTSDDVTGTPTVFINGQELEPTAVVTMVTQIKAAVEQAN
jgi:protein-disulfide isomerase